MRRPPKPEQGPLWPYVTTKETVDPENGRTVFQIIINGHVVGDTDSPDQSIASGIRLVGTKAGWQTLHRLGFTHDKLLISKEWLERRRQWRLEDQNRWAERDRLRKNRPRT